MKFWCLDEFYKKKPNEFQLCGENVTRDYLLGYDVRGKDNRILGWTKGILKIINL